MMRATSGQGEVRRMQSYNKIGYWFVGLALLFLIFPDIDIWFTGLFYEKPEGFFWRDAALPMFSYNAIHTITNYLSIWLVGSLAIQAVVHFQPRLEATKLRERARAHAQRFNLWLNALWHSGSDFLRELALTKAMVQMLAGMARHIREALHLGWQMVWAGLKTIAFRVPAPKLLYLLLALILAPGFIVNSVFKDEWGRARPHQTSVFGGDKAFTPAWIRVQQCQSNCSFVSGHAAMGFYVFAFGFLAQGAWRRRLFVLGCVTGGLVGLGRVIQGDHFLSDVIFSGFIVYFVCWLLYRGFVAMGWLGAETQGDASEPV